MPGAKPMLVTSEGSLYALTRSFGRKSTRARPEKVFEPLRLTAFVTVLLVRPNSALTPARLMFTSAMSSWLISLLGTRTRGS